MRLLFTGDSAVSVCYRVYVHAKLPRKACRLPTYTIQGPGYYNPKLRPRFHLEMSGSSAFMSGVPKGLRMRHQGGPGPGQYIPQSPLSGNTSASNAPWFSSSAQRGAWLRSEKVMLILALLEYVNFSDFSLFCVHVRSNHVVGCACSKLRSLCNMVLIPLVRDFPHNMPITVPFQRT